MIEEISTDRNVVRCSRPLSVYSIKIGGTFSLLRFVVTKTSCDSAVFLKALEGSVAVIFKNTYG